jgi:hypothetical protein
MTRARRALLAAYYVLMFGCAPEAGPPPPRDGDGGVYDPNRPVVLPPLEPDPEPSSLRAPCERTEIFWLGPRRVDVAPPCRTLDPPF